jgi:flagellar basal body-associated protein FliL
MKKKRLLLIILILLILGVVLGIIFIFNSSKSKLSNEVKEKQAIVINNIGVTDASIGYYVFNKDNYYHIYFSSDTNYTSYLYILHKSEEDYLKYKEEYKGNIKVNLNYNDEAYLTIISTSSGTVDDNFLDTIKNNNKDYKMLE